MSFHSANGPVHGYSDGIAVSPGGRLVVAARVDRPANQFDVFDTVSGEHTVIAHPNPRMGVLHPTFSADGRRLAFVVAAASKSNVFTGLAAIWVTDLDGKVERTIAAPGRFYARPAFSSDGRSVAYFRDVLPPPVEGAAGLPLQDRTILPLALFATSLDDGREVRLTSDAFMAVGPVVHRASDHRWYFQAGLHLQRRQREADGAEDWRLPNLATQPSSASAQLQLWSAPSRSTGPLAGPVRPASVFSDEGVLIGATVGGELIFRRTVTGGSGRFVYLVSQVSEEGSRELLRQPDGIFSAVAIDVGGDLLALEEGPSATGSTPAGSRRLVLARPGSPPIPARPPSDAPKTIHLDPSLPPFKPTQDAGDAPVL